MPDLDPIPPSAAVGELPTDAPAATAAPAELPPYAKSLLKISVPLQVTLAAQRKSIQDITELGPGSILSFEKTCEEPMDLMIGEKRIAYGQVVKVGDKFGLRIGGLVK